MSKWLLLLCTGCLVIIAVNSSPILNENDNNNNNNNAESTKENTASVATAAAAVPRQTNEVASTAGAAGAPAAPAAGVAPANPPGQTEEDDDDDDDDDDDLADLTDDDDDDDDDEEGGAASDDDDDDDDDYDFERILDDILGDDDDDEEEEEETSPESVSAAPQAAAAVTAAATAAPAPIQGLAASPGDEVGQESEQNAVSVDEDDQVADENNPHTVTLLTNSQPDDVDEAQEQILNTNDIGTAASAAVATSSSTTAPQESADEEEDDEEEDDDDEDVLSDEDDDEDEDEEEEDEESRRARALGETGNVAVPASYISKYNKYIDSIFARINKVLKKNYDPVNVRLQTAPSTKKKTPTKAPTKTKKKPTPAKPSSRTNTADQITNGTVLETSSERPMRKRSARSDSSQQSRLLRRKRPQLTKANSNKNSNKQKVIRAKATLYGLSSLRRDGDVAVNVLSTHTTVRSKFLVGPLTLKVEKEFGRGAKKELRSAIATTAEMFGKLNLKVVHGGDTTLSSIKVMQPKQMRVEADDENDRTREFLWKRSSTFARVVSQKLANAARSSLPPQADNTNSSVSLFSFE